MAAHEIQDAKFKPKFSGHETFPFRYDWLRKCLIGPLIRDGVAWEVNDSIEQAMVSFGVGKNMVRSMRHWAMVTGAATVTGDSVAPTDFGKRLLLDADPFLERLDTIWLLHWRIATNAENATSWYWMFSHSSFTTVSQASLTDELIRAAAANGWKAVSVGTVQRDVECLLRCYSYGRGKKGEVTEDSIECPLAELELLRPTGDKRMFEFRRGRQPTLPDGVFAFALAEFLDRRGGDHRTLGFDKIAHAPGSPGRVFRLDEDGVAERLERIADVTDGALRWVDTAGIRQLQRIRVTEDTLTYVLASFQEAV